MATLLLFPWEHRGAIFSGGGRKWGDKSQPRKGEKRPRTAVRCAYPPLPGRSRDAVHFTNS